MTSIIDRTGNRENLIRKQIQRKNNKREERDTTRLKKSSISRCFVGDFNLFNRRFDDLLLLFTIGKQCKPHYRRMFLCQKVFEVRSKEFQRKSLNLIKTAIRSTYRFQLLGVVYQLERILFR